MITCCWWPNVGPTADRADRDTTSERHVTMSQLLPLCEVPCPELTQSTSIHSSFFFSVSPESVIHPQRPHPLIVPKNLKIANTSPYPHIWRSRYALWCILYLERHLIVMVGCGASRSSCWGTRLERTNPPLNFKTRQRLVLYWSDYS